MFIIKKLMYFNDRHTAQYEPVRVKKTLISIFVFLFLLTSSAIKANDEVEDVCGKQIENRICSGGFTDWKYADSAEWIQYNDCDICSTCLLRVWYKYRGCKEDPTIVEIEITKMYYAAVTDTSTHPYIESCKDLFDIYIAHLDPQDSLIDVSWIEQSVYRKLTQAILNTTYDTFLKIVKNPEDYEYILPKCNVDTALHVPMKYVWKRRGACKGWCHTQCPIGAEFQNIAPPKGMRYMNPDELSRLNDYVQTKIVPYMIPGTTILPFTELSLATGVWVPINCFEEDWCCITLIHHCIKKDANDNPIYHFDSTQNKFIFEWDDYEEEGWGNWPSNTESCEKKLVDRKYCIPGSNVIQGPCKLVCSGNIPIIPNDPASIINNNTITEIIVSPNPTNNGTAVTFKVLESGKLNMLLVDINGKEVLELYDNIVEVGEFTKNFSMSKLTKGVYYLKISINNKVKMEKVVRN